MNDEQDDTTRGVNESRASSGTGPWWNGRIDGDGVRIHGNWCGPGGGGPAKDRTDDACRAHDACYDEAGVTAVDRTLMALLRRLRPEEARAAERCDAALCDTLSKVSPETRIEARDRGIVLRVFGCPVAPDPGRGSR